MSAVRNRQRAVSLLLKNQRGRTQKKKKKLSQHDFRGNGSRARAAKPRVARAPEGERKERLLCFHRRL